MCNGEIEALSSSLCPTVFERKRRLCLTPAWGKARYEASLSWFRGQKPLLLLCRQLGLSSWAKEVDFGGRAISRDCVLRRVRVVLCFLPELCPGFGYKLSELRFVGVGRGRCVGRWRGGRGGVLFLCGGVVSVFCRRYPESLRIFPASPLPIAEIPLWKHLLFVHSAGVE